MRLCIYRGLDNERVPEDVTHVTVEESVTIIKTEAFHGCVHLVSVIMGDNVKRIENYAFMSCYALRFIRLSKTLHYIGFKAFSYCESLEALFLPSTLRVFDQSSDYVLSETNQENASKRRRTEN